MAETAKKDGGLRLADERQAVSVRHRVAEGILRDLVRSHLTPGSRIRPQREIAREYGVSYLTAQRAINILRDRGILEVRHGDGTYFVGGPQWAALKRETGNGLAGATLAPSRSEKRTRTIGVVLPYWVNESTWGYPSGLVALQRIINGLMVQCDQHRWKIQLIHSGVPDASARPGFVERIMEHEVDGVAWLRPMPTHRMNLMRLVDRGVDVVCCGRRFRDLPIVTVSEDYADMAAKVMDRLVSEDRREFVLLSGVSEGLMTDPYAADIEREMRRAAEERGLGMPRSAVCQSCWHPAEERMVRSFLSEHRDTQAIICVFQTTVKMVIRLAREGFWSDLSRLLLVDLIYEFAPGDPVGAGSMSVVGVANPMEEIGRGMAQVFEEHWLGQSSGKKPDLSVRLVTPGEEMQSAGSSSQGQGDRAIQP